MVSRSRNSLKRFALVLLCALVACGPLFAEPELDELKKEIKKLEATLPELEKQYNAAVKSFNENKSAQARAKGKELAALKTEGMKLSRQVAEKADTMRNRRQQIATRQGEVRETAADHAVTRMNANGNRAERIRDAIFAMEDWEASLGPLPEVPEPRDLSNFVDPLLKAAARKEDKKRFEAYDDWAAEEEDRLEEEIEKVDKLLGKKKAVDGADDAKHYLDEAGKLKKTLDDRHERVKKLREKAATELKKLD